MYLRDMKIPFAKIKKDLANRLELIWNSPDQKAGLNWYQKRKLKYASATKLKKYQFKGHTVFYKNGIELKHSLSEIFIDEIYKIKLSNPAPEIIDCGSNIGLSVMYFKQHFPTAHIVAFEPDSGNFELLTINTKAYSNVDLYNKAVWNENAQLSFSNTGSMDSSLLNHGDSQSSTIVEAVRLRDLITSKIDLLKLDIEGAEFKVLADCDDKLSAVDNIFIEYHGKFSEIDELLTIFSILRKNGFAFYIKEAANIYPNPFYRKKSTSSFDIQLNIFCFKPDKYE